MRHRSISLGVIIAATFAMPLSLVGQPGQNSAAGSSAAATPRTPWGEPDIQGIWTADGLAGVPLERPSSTAAALTKEEAVARRAGATGGLNESRDSLGSYGWEFRDIAPAFAKTAPSTQVAIVVDPPDGKVPALTPEGQKRFADRARGSRQNNSPHSWTDQGTWDRCITRGLPNIMMPLGYNNNVQIVQSPGYVVITHEMIHEARIIPTDNRPHLGPKLRQWLGDPHGRWEGNTLVVDIKNFNGKQLYTPAVAGSAGNVQASAPWDSTFHADGALHAHRRAHDRLPRHGRGSDDLDQAVHAERAAHEGRYAIRARRVRVPRGELRAAEHPERRARRGARGGRQGREAYSKVAAVLVGGAELQPDTGGATLTAVSSPRATSMLRVSNCQFSR